MSSISLAISEKDNKLKSALSLMLHNSFTVAASDIFCLFCYNCYVCYVPLQIFSSHNEQSVDSI